MRKRYLDLLRDTLINRHYLQHEPPTRVGDDHPPVIRARRRNEGRDWPAWAPTMCGALRLDSLRDCIERCAAENLEGDIVETGVWRGGAMVFARACLDAYNLPGKVWLCDSFQGAPRPDQSSWAEDAGSRYHLLDQVKATRAECEASFETFGVSTEGVEFLEGYFEDTLPGPLAERDITILRLDANMYGSTMHTLNVLFDRILPGGFLIADDWVACPEERQAILDFFATRGIIDDGWMVDWTCRVWRL